MILGYIISKHKLKNLPSFIAVVSDINEIEDKDKPKLIVGLENAKAYSGESFKIYQKQIDNKLFWTFGKTEKRIEYEKDVVLFIKFIINDILNKIPYYYIDISKLRYTNVKNLINIINSIQGNNIYICGDMVYIYNGAYILGLSLAICNYCNIKSGKLLSRIRINKNNRIIYNDSNVDIELKRAINNKKYILAYLLSMN